MSYAHFIITRFNLRREASDGRAIDPGWLRQRFELFERFCLPTVQAQTVQNFRWLVLLDDQTPESALRRIDCYAKWPVLTPVFFAAGEREQARRAVEEQLGGSRPRALLTTRLDNDDGVCRTFVETVQRHADAAETTLVEFPVGYVWHDERLYLDRQERNPFSTLIEPLDGGGGGEFRTVYGTSHHEIGQGCRVVEASAEPSWVQVIHGGNVANRERGVRTPMSALGEEFAIRGVRPSESRVELGLDIVRSAIRDRVMRAVQGLRRRAA
jgi:hypothetical protein